MSAIVDSEYLVEDSGFTWLETVGFNMVLSRAVVAGKVAAELSSGSSL